MTADKSENVFEETDAAEEETTEETKAEPEKEEGETEEEAGEESEEEEESEGDEEKEESETPADEDEEEEKVVPVAALQSERQKRQAAEEKLARYEATAAPDRDTDPEGHERHLRMEMSRDIMRGSHDDYDDMIAHYAAMEKANPALAQIVANDRNPAKLAYSLAKEDKEITKLQELSKSDDWKEFQKWKKSQTKAAVSEEKPDRNKAALSTPNLNRATSVKARTPKPEDDNVFAGAPY